MIRSLLLLVPFQFSVACLAQVASNDLKDHYNKQASLCGGWDSIFSIKGKWKKTSDDLAFPDKTFDRSQYKYINARVDSISVFLKSAITDLSAVEAKWQRNIRGDSYIANGPVPYSFNSGFFRYYCNDSYKKIILGDETSNWVYVFVNSLNWFLRKADEWDINNDGILRSVSQLPAKTGEWKGMPVYEPTFFSGSGTISRAVIIGHDGKLPWRSLTQKQYLTGLKNDYEKQLLKFKKGSGYEADYKQRLKYINDYFAAASEETLEKIAVIHPKAGIWGFKGQFGKEDEGGFRLILFSAAGNKYFDKNLPRYSPQLIEVMWKYNPYDPVALRVIKQFEENFPLEKLKAMIR